MIKKVPIFSDMDLCKRKALEYIPPGFAITKNSLLSFRPLGLDAIDGFYPVKISSRLFILNRAFMGEKPGKLLAWEDPDNSDHVLFISNGEFLNPKTYFTNTKLFKELADGGFYIFFSFPGRWGEGLFDSSYGNQRRLIRMRLMEYIRCVRPHGWTRFTRDGILIGEK